MNVYIITEDTGVDYHGERTEIIAVYATKDKAERRIKQLKEENTNYRVEYDYHIYSVIQ